MPDKLHLAIILTSTREGRAGLPVAEWFVEKAIEHGDFDIEFIDLREVDLPMMDEPRHPRLRQYEHQHTREWSARIDAADAFVFITPEYNHGYTAPFKNAIDYLHHEWEYKPAAMVSYGGVSAGTRTVESIKQVLTTLKMMPMFETVAIPFIASFLDEQRRFKNNEVTDTAAAAMLSELHKWAVALKPMRAVAAEVAH
jgi:NAD(P)H-dependent FMN reductase